MPIYVFACKECNSKKEHLLKINEIIDKCPNCNSYNYEKQLTAPNISSGESNFTPCGKEREEVKTYGCASGSCGCA